jgi:hypothetical protein
MDTQTVTVAQSTDDPKPRKKLLAGYTPDDEAAAEIGCTVRTLRNMPDGPPYVVLNRKRFYPDDQFRKWLAKRLKSAR